ncbi:tetratricopeptide repeat protein [Haliangium sp.]|uniref:tetratricopeptide repeat protein n=1 Tax=Haliangium sp. TaxID=2663208 RepID=UPI003D103E94
MMPASYPPTGAETTHLGVAVVQGHAAAAGLVLAALLMLAPAGCGARPAAAPAPSTQALLEQAEAAHAQRRYDRAEALYRQARAEAPDDDSRALAARAHGRALITWGELEPAAAALAEATRLRPDDAGAWHDLGMVRHQLGDPAAAEAAFRSSIAARPDDARSRIALAALLWKHERHRAALREYEALAELTLPTRVREQVEWAIATLRRRLAEDPGATP